MRKWQLKCNSTDLEIFSLKFNLRLSYTRSDQSELAEKVILYFMLQILLSNTFIFIFQWHEYNQSNQDTQENSSVQV